MALIYIATNLINGKRYIGVTAATMRKRRYYHVWDAMNGRGYCRKLAAAIRKYGPDMFRFAVLKRVAGYKAALSEEARLIAVLRPEYNITAGGHGLIGFKHSEETKRRLSKARRGRPLSDAQRRTLRELGLANRDKWATFASLGPRARARSVICIDHQRTFESAAAAARHYGVSASAITELCRGQRFRETVGGLKFAYGGEA